MCEGEGKGCGHGYLATAVRWTDPSGIVPHSGCAKQSAPTFLHLSQPNRTPTLNHTRADVTRRSLASTQLRRARAYRTRTGGSTTVLAVLAGRIASSKRSTGIDATHAGRIYNSRKCPGTHYSQVETRILTRHYRTIVQSPLYFNGYCISTAMSTRLKDTHSIWILNTPVAKCFQTSFRLVTRARFCFLSRFLSCVPLRRLAFD